jgi:uncharacterized protein (TIRG00374 family)
LPKLVASLFIGGAFAWLLERGGLPLVPEASAFAKMAWWAIPVAILTNAISSYFRTCRWIFLLRPIAPTLSTARVLGIGFVGFTAITMAPLRTGEFVRPYLLARDGEVTFTQGLGATLAERIIDGFVVTISLFVALFVATPLSPLPNHLGDLRLDVALVPKAAYSALSVFAVALLTLVAFQWKHDLFVRILDAVIGTVSKRLAAFVTSKVERVAAGLRFFPSSRDLLPFARATAAYYAALALGYWATLVGCGIPATLAETWVLIGVLSLAILVPAGPGFFGAYQLSIYYGLAMFFPENVALSAGAAFVFITYVTQIGVTMLSCVLGFALMAMNPASRAQPGGTVLGAMPRP